MTTKQVLVSSLPPNRISVMHADGVSPSKTDLERLFGKSDLLDLNYFWRGMIAAKSVARIVLRDEDNGNPVGYASGFMVSPKLMLTNHHVFPEASAATYSLAEFDDERGLMGEPPNPVQFRFVPGEFFINDEELDFALVAVALASENENFPLSRYSWLRLNPTPGKEVKGEYVSIIQHPEAEPTQIAVRENQIVEVLPTLLRYQTDTQPGSSGAPVFNDSWQVVALHHSAVPGSGPDGKYVANEGIRISSLLAHLVESNMQHPLLQELMACANAEKPWSLDVLRYAFYKGDTIAQSEMQRWSARGALRAEAGHMTPEGTRVIVPLEIIIGSGNATRPMPRQQNVPSLPRTTWSSPRTKTAPLVEKLVFDNDYSDRKGYDRMFLGIPLDLPTFKDDTGSILVTFADGSKWLPYHHFSVATNHARKLPHVVATNVDYGPRQRLDIARKDFGTDQWIADPRIALDAQTTARDQVYSDPNVDYGHVNRREDNCWGDSKDEVVAANSDTFHFTNCTPQHKAFNRSNLKGLWGELENQISLQSKSHYPRLSIFAGPVLDPGDGPLGQVPATYKVPRRFWKVVVTKADAGDSLRAYGFILDQRAAFGVPAEEFDPGAFKAYLVPLSEIEQITGIAFSKTLLQSDVHAETERLELTDQNWLAQVGSTAQRTKSVPTSEHTAPDLDHGKRFGRFPTLSAFLDEYRQAQSQEVLPQQFKELKRIPDVVEVKAIILEHEPDDNDVNGGRHYRLQLRIKDVLQSDPDVRDDIQEAMNEQTTVFCAIRFGDSMGIRAKIEGLDKGTELHMQGQWITSAKAKEHGGEKMSVLHFTHHPIGFTCTPVKCYS